jgi:hypothetical protein
VSFAPFIEWLEYRSYLAEDLVLQRALRSDDEPISIGLTGLIPRSSLGLIHERVARELGWGKRPTVSEAVEAATPHINPALAGLGFAVSRGPCTTGSRRMVPDRSLDVCAGRSRKLRVQGEPIEIARRAQRRLGPPRPRLPPLAV